MSVKRTIAYFSMEIGLESQIPTYSGGLGVLAGDTIRSAADLRVPLVAVSLLHRKGYFRQHLDGHGNQYEEPHEWPVERFMEEMPVRAAVTIEGRTVILRVWKYRVTGVTGFRVPVYLLDSDIPENNPYDRTLTHSMYGGDDYYRLCQEVVLGIGGVRMLRTLGYHDIWRFHLNEGHAALLPLELLEEQLRISGRTTPDAADLERVRRLCVFTTHTPVSAGHDKFPMEFAWKVLGQHESFNLPNVFNHGDMLHMSLLAATMSSYVNGVAKKHGEVSRDMFDMPEIDTITNGVHAGTWVSNPFQRLFDLHIPDWRIDNFALRNALNIPEKELWYAHVEAKRDLLSFVNSRTGMGLEEDLFTIGFARRATPYKRTDLIFRDIERLKHIAHNVGRFQIVFAGKAHPRDGGGKDLIRSVFSAAQGLGSHVKVVYLEDYNMDMGKLLATGCDLWLNTPEPPLEASGTSGMKSALNGVPSLSTLDGWWLEGCMEGVTGWAIDLPTFRANGEIDRGPEISSMYQKLEHAIIPIYYNQRERFIDIMRHAIALNGSFFNTQRMVQEYVVKAYFRQNSRADARFLLQS